MPISCTSFSRFCISKTKTAVEHIQKKPVSQIHLNMFAASRFASQQVLKSIQNVSMRFVATQPPTALQHELATLAQFQPINANYRKNISEAFGLWTWLIKRTFQPSIIRKKRKCGYLKRSKSVGGRKILRRRMQKGRARLFGA